MVRLAEGLDRSHAQVAAGVKVTLRGDRLTVRLDTHDDAELELWAADRHGAVLAEVLGLEIVITRAARARRGTRRPSPGPGRKATQSRPAKSTRRAPAR